jgi:ubiquitin thioesterase OTU1
MRLPLTTSSPGVCWVQAHEARQFTDVASFTLRCGVCQIGVRGEREAVEHAKATGHSNFSEYH